MGTERGKWQTAVNWTLFVINFSVEWIQGKGRGWWVLGFDPPPG
ncbi:MAG TPA: hypothetical protein PLD25_05575 [Chloroflexota bacterium]|nr:hypothetical protein [Chloroflexota bacterium]HUM71262.1 hypothetical protein [Chloroflexota bacterium]